MRVILSFDVEVWCESWSNLEGSFGPCFDTCVHGLPPGAREGAHSYGLQSILDLLNRHHLHGVFFVEPLFSARFGRPFLQTIVAMIRAAGQEVQLHLHPEWVDEIRPSFISGCDIKRPMLASYSLIDQIALIRWASDLLEEAGAPRPTAFRAGNFGANRDTLTALARNDIWLDSSFNRTCGSSLHGDAGSGDERLLHPFFADGVCSIPVSVFRDFRGRLRHAQVGACSVDELSEAMSTAQHSGHDQFVILAHNFEMIHRKARQPNQIVANRFQALFSRLEDARNSLPTGSLRVSVNAFREHQPLPIPRVSAAATFRRFWEQFRQLPPPPLTSTGEKHVATSNFR